MSGAPLTFRSSPSPLAEGWGEGPPSKCGNAAPSPRGRGRCEAAGEGYPLSSSSGRSATGGPSTSRATIACRSPCRDPSTARRLRRTEPGWCRCIGATRGTSSRREVNPIGASCLSIQGDSSSSSSLFFVVPPDGLVRLRELLALPHAPLQIQTTGLQHAAPLLRPSRELLVLPFLVVHSHHSPSGPGRGEVVITAAPPRPPPCSATHAWRCPPGRSAYGSSP